MPKMLVCVGRFAQAKGKTVIVTAGDGVDLDAFSAAPLPSVDQPLTFVMIANPDARDAIGAYAEAARALSGRGCPPGACLQQTGRQPRTPRSSLCRGWRFTGGQRTRGAAGGGACRCSSFGGGWLADGREAGTSSGPARVDP